MEATSKKAVASLRRFTRIAAMVVVTSSLVSSVALANQGNGNGGGNPNSTTTSTSSTTSTTSTTVARGIITTFTSPLTVSNMASSGCTSNEPAWVTTNRADLWHLVVGSGTTTVTIEQIMAGSATVLFGSSSQVASFISEFSSNQGGVAKHIYLRTSNPTLTKGQAMPTGFTLTWSGNGTIGQTQFSHYCLLSDQTPPPVIDVVSAVPSYGESFTESHAWSVSKSLDLADGEDPVVKWFSQGLKPVYKIAGTRAPAAADAGSYRVDSAQVTGTFSLQDATLADATVSLVPADGSGLTGGVCQTSGSSSPYSYTCTLGGLGAFTGSSSGLLSGKGFTISGSVTNGNTDPLAGSFASSPSSPASARSTSGVTASLTDDLAGLGGSGCSTSSGSCSISGGLLSVTGIGGDFTVTYTGGWDYANYYTVTPFAPSPNACQATKTNVATLTPDGQSPKTADFGLTPQCPTPTVSLGNITSSYNLSYTDTYSWDVAKTLKAVDAATKVASYEVTATRSGPVSSNVSGSSITISGGFSTTYAPSANVSVSVTAVGGTTLGSSIPCTVNPGTDSYSCTVPETTSGLKTLGVADIANGWYGTAFTVQATVATGGGSNTASNNGTVGTQAEPNITKVNASASITDDLDSQKYSASNIACTSDSASCLSGSTTVAKGNSIQTSTSENQIVLTYDMNWLPDGVVFGATCPTIANKAEVVSGSTSLDSDTQEDQMTCPAINVATSDSSYGESFTESHAWSVSKSLDLADGEDPVVKWFSQGLKPVYKIAGTRAPAAADAGSYRVDSAQVTGTFSLQDATLADATVSLVPADGSGLTGGVCQTSGSSSPYSYTCTLGGLGAFTGSSSGLLSGKGFTISGSVTNGNTDPLAGSFASSPSSPASARSTSGVTASLTDDLAGLGGSGCSTSSGSCSISGGLLSVTGIGGDFTVTYTGGWDYANYYTVTPFAPSPNACQATKTNVATLTPDGQSPKTADFGLTPQCPTPTVSLGNITSSYNLSYTDTYSWDVAKTLKAVDAATKVASYEVTATRSGPVSSNVSGSSITISGGFSTTYAPSANVSVSVTAVGGTTLGSSIPCTVNPGTDSYSCTVPETTSGLKTLGVADIANGWYGTAFTVQATVATGGGSNTASNNGTVGTQAEPNITKVNASASITDDLDSQKYSASNIACTSDSASCLSGSTTVAKGNSIQTSTSENQIVLTYDMNWLPDGVVFGATCPTIANKAEVVSGSTSLDSDTQEDQMTCPQLTMSITSTTSQYSQQSDNSYTWSLVKTALQSDSVTWQPRYQVVATRGAAVPVPNSWRIVDTTQKVTGVMTIVLNPQTSVITLEQANAALKLDGEDCTISATNTAGQFGFTCTKGTEDTVNSTNGLNGKPYVLTWTGGAYKKAPSCALPSATECATADTKWGNATGTVPGNDVNAKASIVDSNVITNTSNGYGAVSGTITNGTQSTANTLKSNETSNSVTMTYTLNWQFNNGAGCNQSITNTASLINDKNETIVPASGSIVSRTVVVSCGRSEPGLTIGFYGNKQGGKQVVDYRANWRSGSNGIGWTVAPPKWNTVLISLPDFGSDTAVRDYMNAANCNSSGANSNGFTCRTMFRAQALASVMNAIKSQAFADQSVMFQGACTKVSKLFTDALASTTIDAGTTPTLIASRIAYKSIFDDLNNSRATRCPNP